MEDPELFNLSQLWRLENTRKHHRLIITGEVIVIDNSNLSFLLGTHLRICYQIIRNLVLLGVTVYHLYFRLNLIGFVFEYYLTEGDSRHSIIRFNIL